MQCQRVIQFEGHMPRLFIFLNIARIIFRVCGINNEKKIIFGSQAPLKGQIDEVGPITQAKIYIQM